LEAGKVILNRAIEWLAEDVEKIEMLVDEDHSGLLTIKTFAKCARFLSKTPSTKKYRQCPDFVSNQIQPEIRVEFGPKGIPQPFRTWIEKDPFLKALFSGKESTLDLTIPPLFSDPVLTRSYAEAVWDLTRDAQNEEEVVRIVWGAKRKFEEMLIQKYS